MTSTEASSGGMQNDLKRTLGNRFALAVTVGGVIGLGILRTPGEIAGVVPDPLCNMRANRRSRQGMFCLQLIFGFNG